MPKLLVIGTGDAFCSVSRFEAFVESLPEPRESHVLDGVDHFSLFPHLKPLLTDWVTSAFGVPTLTALATGDGSTAAGMASASVGP